MGITRAPRSGCPLSKRIAALLLGGLLCLDALAQGGASGGLQGRPLWEVLDEQREAGLPLVYSTALVTPGLVVQGEPLHREPVALIEEILAPHGLSLRESDGRYFVVAATAPDPASPEEPEASADGEASGPVELERLNVSASRYLLWSNSQFFVDQRAIQSLPDLGEDPVRAAQRLPGAAAGGLSSRSHFRGGEDNETAIYLNGLKLLDPFHIRDYHNIFSTIDARSISGIEAYTGGFPATWGDRMSGMLLMETRVPEKALETELGLSFYNTSFLNSGYTANQAVDWLVSARRSNLDAVLSDDLGKPDYFDVFAMLGLPFGDDHRLSLNVLFADDQVLVITESDPEEIEQSKSNTRNAHAWLSLQDQWTAAFSTRTVLSMSSLDNRRIAEANDPERMTAAVVDLRAVDIIGLQQEFHYSDLGPQDLRWGVELQHADARYDYRSHANYNGFYEYYPGIENPRRSDILASPSGWGYGLYFSDRVRLSETTGLELGLRWDRQTWTQPIYGSQLSPRVSILHRLAGNTELRLTWGRYSQSQGVQELQVEDGVDHFFAPQRANHWIAGVQRRFENGYRLRVEAFSKDYDRLRPRFENLFDPQALIPELAPDRVRLDPSRAGARGIELTLEYRGKEFEWWAVYSWSRAADTINGHSELRSWDQRHALQAGLAYRRGPWEIGLAASLHTGWPTTEMTLGEAVEDGEIVYLPVPGPRNAERYATFGQLDFRVSREFAVRWGRLSAFLELTNATDRKNPCCTDYDVDETDDGVVYLDRTVEHWLPLLPAVGVLWQF